MDTHTYTVGHVEGESYDVFRDGKFVAEFKLNQTASIVAGILNSETTALREENERLRKALANIESDKCQCSFPEHDNRPRMCRGDCPSAIARQALAPDPAKVGAGEEGKDGPPVEPMAWAVYCPPGHEYDYMVFWDEQDAKQQDGAWVLDGHEEDRTTGVIPLYPKDPTP